MSDVGRGVLRGWDICWGKGLIDCYMTVDNMILRMCDMKCFLIRKSRRNRIDEDIRKGCKKDGGGGGVV